MIYESGLISLAVQLITGGIDVWGLMHPVTKKTKTLNQLLKVELSVQIVELLFYVWLIFNIKNIKNITVNRYYDWFITTPTMLITFMILLSLNPEATNIPSLPEFIKENRTDILAVVFLNAMMLLLGLLGEITPKSNLVYVFAGMIPFLMYFYKIYNHFVKPNKDKPSYIPRDKVFFYFFIIWALYAVAALMPYNAKNIMYNILDLFAKNFLGVFLVYLIKTRA